MIGTCSKCGNYNWDKIVENGKVKCPKCNFEWDYISLPLFILSGCSGIGKTTAAIEIMRSTSEIIVLDSDVFCGIQQASSLEDYRNRIELIQSISKNINQSGRPVLWTVAGNLDMFPTSYNRKFFSEIYCLALVADDRTIIDHMKNGRGITDSEWINSSLEYNEYFKLHNTIGELTFDTLCIEAKSPSEVAADILKWVFSKMNKNTEA